ncbi:hypothetical protein GF354_04215 [Candidatus Peregrinibacteria bacterium]|nr:hypothetical protein [Candidatus Peregrinibacteria bacterium]
MKKGKFITIYGINNIGKSTHAKILVEKLKEQGHKAVYVKYPVYDVEPSGPYINKILRGGSEQQISEEEFQMWYAINRYQFQPQIQKYIDEGYTIIAEDYRFTGIAWGMAKGLPENWVTDLNSRMIEEDLVIMFEGNRDLSAKEKTHVHEQNDELAEKCEQVHNYLAKKYNWKRVEVQTKIEDTAALVWKIVEEWLTF